MGISDISKCIFVLIWKENTYFQNVLQNKNSEMFWFQENMEFWIFFYILLLYVYIVVTLAHGDTLVIAPLLTTYLL